MDPENFTCEEITEDFFKLICTGCNDEYNIENKQPFRLECGHSFCLPCMKKICESNSCLTCQKDNFPQDKPINATTNPALLKACENMQLYKQFVENNILSVQALVEKLETRLKEFASEEEAMGNTLDILTKIKDEQKRVEGFYHNKKYVLTPFKTINKLEYFEKIVRAFQNEEEVYYYNILDNRYRSGQVSLESTRVYFHSSSLMTEPNHKVLLVSLAFALENENIVKGAFLKFRSGDFVARTINMHLVQSDLTEHFLQRCAGIYNGSNYKDQSFTKGASDINMTGIMEVILSSSYQNRISESYPIYRPTFYGYPGDVIVLGNEFGNFCIVHIVRMCLLTNAIGRVIDGMDTFCIDYNNPEELKIVDCGVYMDIRYDH